jgi:hypothetical protein
MGERDPLDSALRDVKALEQFLFAFIGGLAARPPKPGEDVTDRADELGLTVPAAWAGERILWADGRDDAPADRQEHTLVLVRPGDPAALGFTIGCITVRGHRYCLECGWLYCRIVIRF